MKWFIASIFTILIATVRLEDQHCMDKATKEITVEIGCDNPQRVISYVRDEPGYQVNLQCKWILKPANYESPRQMFIQISVVDFDTNNVTEEECKNAIADLDRFYFMLKLNESAFLNERWCSNQSVTIRQQIVNLLDPSYNLTLEFRSDDKQVRSDAKGVQVDVQVLGRDYCHRSMLYLNGSCYLITPQLLTPEHAFKLSKNYLGNLFIVPKEENVSAFLSRFFQTNAKRSEQFPYESPLILAGRKMWTGYFVEPSDKQNKGFKSVSFLDSNSNCTIGSQELNVFSTRNVSSSRCAIAISWSRDGSAKFTCESMDHKLPALIEFKQIPSIMKADLRPQLFRTCDTLPTILVPTPELSSKDSSISSNFVLAIVMPIVAISVFFGAVVLYLLWKKEILRFGRAENPDTDNRQYQSISLKEDCQTNVACSTGNQISQVTQHQDAGRTEKIVSAAC